MAKQTFTTGQILTAAQMTTLQANDYNWTVNAKTASYVLVATDAGTRVTMNSASATTITVNTALFTAGDTLEIINIGIGVCTITAGTATVSTSATLALKQYDAGTLYFTSASASIFLSSDAADSPLTTKGDLYTYSTTNDRLAVGSTNGQVLTVDSTAATGLAWSTQGFVLINTTSFSAVSSQTIDSLFSSTYQNYRMILTLSAVSATNPNILGYFRSAGADVTTNNNTESITQYSTTIAGAERSPLIEFGVSSTSYPSFSVSSVDIFNPQLARVTSFSANGGFVTNAGVPYQYRSYGYNNSTTQMTGINIYPSTGTMTGEVSIYGMRK